MAACILAIASCKKDKLQSSADITAFAVNDVAWTISGTNITHTYPTETQEGSLTPTITLSPGATVSPASGAAQDFFTPQGVTYTVTAEDGVTKKTYTAKAVITPVVSGETGSCIWAITGVEDNYTLTISGNGAMENYSRDNPRPWEEFLTGIKTLIIHDGVTTAGDFAFDGCSSLTSVTIGNSVTTISNYAFYYCSALTDINVDAANAAYSSAGGVLFNKEQTTLITCPVGKNGSYVIPNSVITIGDEAFYNCSGLTSVTIPNSVTTVGEEAFTYCHGLTSVTIPHSVTTIGTFAFFDCSGLTSVTIGNSVTTIGDYAFNNCSNLTSVTIPNSVTTVGVGTFFDCSDLTSVTIGNSVTTIGMDAFYGCSGLTSVTIGNSVTTIGDYAFSNCSGLTSVTIPNSVTTIGECAFSGCSGLTSVTNLRAVPQSISSYVFRNITLSGLTLKVPASSKTAYEEAPVWKNFGTIEATQ
ncbi:MAG: leucine-rich repeat protein [Bacteroidales bacterium]|nr:leucine-rich repeat protein [Bacteroidales bacterium]